MSWPRGGRVPRASRPAREPCTHRRRLVGGESLAFSCPCLTGLFCVAQPCVVPCPGSQGSTLRCGERRPPTSLGLCAVLSPPVTPLDSVRPGSGSCHLPPQPPGNTLREPGKPLLPAGQHVPGGGSQLACPAARVSWGHLRHSASSPCWGRSQRSAGRGCGRLCRKRL